MEPNQRKVMSGELPQVQQCLDSGKLVRDHVLNVWTVHIIYDIVLLPLLSYSWSTQTAPKQVSVLRVFYSSSVLLVSTGNPSV